MALIFIFIDGLGIGEPGEFNPLSNNTWRGFEAFSGSPLVSDKFKSAAFADHHVTRIDACLGVEGLPQSGTGQATLFSGENASKLLGRHHGPYPHTKIKPLLGKPSIFGKAAAMGYRCHFMNAYPDRFFEYAEKHNRWSCTTKMCIENGIRLNREEDVREERAITAEIFQDIWQKRLGIDLPDINEKDAAGRIDRAADLYDIILYEYYLTDKAGHAKDTTEAADALTRIDQLLNAVNNQMDFTRHCVLICSDHGNVEDLSTKTHTRNNVPLMVKGRGAGAFGEVASLIDITPAMLTWLQKFRSPKPS